MPGIHQSISLNGRRAFVTGAAGGLGSMMAETLAELGAELILVEHPGIDIVKQKADLQQRWDVEVQVYSCDLESETSRQALIDNLKAEDKPLHVLLNNAAFVGTSDLDGWAMPFDSQSVGTWRRALEVNLTAPFHLCKGLAPLLAREPVGSIVNIGSIYGQYGPDWRLYEGTVMSNPAAYGASKGGLLQLTRWLATTLAPTVRVNTISPGGIERGQPMTFQSRYKERTPMGRMATAHDIQGAVIFLATDLSAYITGQTINVDGGWGVW